MTSHSVIPIILLVQILSNISFRSFRTVSCNIYKYESAAISVSFVPVTTHVFDKNFTIMYTDEEMKNKE